MAYNFGITLDELYRAIGREVYEQCIESKSLARVDERGLFPTPYVRNDYEKADGNAIAREGFASFAEMNVEVCDLLNEFPEGHFTRVVVQLVAFVNIYQAMSNSYFTSRVVSNVIDMPLDETPNRIMRIDCQRLLYPNKVK